MSLLTETGCSMHLQKGIERAMSSEVSWHHELLLIATFLSFPLSISMFQAVSAPYALSVFEESSEAPASFPPDIQKS